MRRLVYTNALFFIALFTYTTNGETIAWTSLKNISGDSDVSTNGTLVDAFNFGASGAGNPTINGVTFSEFAIADGATSITIGNYTLSGPTNGLTGYNGVGSSSSPFNSLSSPYKLLVGTTGASIVTPYGLTLAMRGLTVGADYEFQWWSSRSDRDFGPEVTATLGNSITLNPNTSAALGGVGQFALGTFKAENTSVEINLSSTFVARINGFQLRDVSGTVGQAAAVPLPGVAAGGLLLFGMVGARRLLARACRAES